MKKETRCILSCSKTLSNGIREVFETVVLNNERDVIRKNYESRGYTVVVLNR